MAMGSLSDNEDDFNPEINTTPLVDVMLVLLIVFMITIPVIQHSIKVDLPRATNVPNNTQEQAINLSIDAQGKVYWNTILIDVQELKKRIAEAAQHQPQPALHLRADRTTQYEKVAQVMAAAQAGGLSKMGFVTDPNVK